MNDIAQAVAAAQQLLASYEAAHPERSDPLAATPIDALVAWQGVAVERFNPVDAPPGTLGWLEPGEDLIWLSMSLDEPVRRFTLAHELGHWVLHRRVGGSPSGSLVGLAPATDQPGACTVEDIEAYLATDLVEDELLRPGQSYSPRARRERAADAFAAALLAPLERVRTLLLGTLEREPLDPERLAAHFGITLQALLGRLAELLREPATPGEPALQQTPVTPAERPASAPRAYDLWQRAAIVAATPALVVAGPGSGKTSTLVGRVRHIVEEQGIAPNRILALTFSNKAALEMRERIASLLGTGAEAAAGAVLPTVSTFHSFCADLLRLYAAQVGLRPDFALLDLPGSYFLLRKVASRLPLRHYGHLSHPELHFAALLGAISRAKDELATPADYLRLAEDALAGAESDEERLSAEKAREVAQVYQVYQQALAAQGDADFGDLILLAVQFLQRTPAALAELHERYQQILVDEFQDINRASGVLLKLLAGERRTIWVVGDQDQAIYRFRGASPANIGQFHRDYPGAQVLPLSRNYRSLADIVAAAGAFREAALRFPVSDQPQAESEEADEHAVSAPSPEPPAVSTSQEAVRQPPAEPVITLAAAPDAESEVAGLVAAIEARHAGGVPYRDQVILCRTREHARMVIEGLERVGTPASAGGSLLEQADVKDLLAIVALLAEPSGMGLLRAAAQPDHLIPRDDLLALFAYAQRETIPAGVLLWLTDRLPELSPQGFAGVLRLADILADLRATPDLWTLLAQYVFIQTSLARRLLQANDQASRQRLDHLRGLLDLARRFDAQEREREADEQAETVEPGKRWERFLEYLRVLIELRADDAGRREPEEGDGEAADMVRVMTVHASKGLEFPVVYLPQLAQQRFPVTMRGEATPMPPGLCEDETARSRQDARAAHLLDEACLFYVGLTRARDELVLSYAERYKKRRAQPSDFLRHIETAPGARLRRVRWGEGDLALPSEKPGREQNAADGLALEQALPARQAVLSVGELETYLRCPRQYQYRYIYGFQPMEQGYRQFYECVQRTVRVLHERLAAPSASAEPGFSLEAAQELFTELWRQYGPLEHPFVESYFAHGQRVIERTWSGLTGAADQQETEASSDGEASPPAKLPTSSRLSQKLDARLDGDTIQVTVDRVEEDGLLLAVDPERPVRLVRHRLSGKNEEKADVEVRHVLYSLAQEQRTPGRPVEVYEHNLSTGALVPVSLDGRAAQNRRADLAAALAGMRARRYPPKPDRHFCPRCPFLMICPAE